MAQYHEFPIEVPLDKVAETEVLLRSHSITTPVVAIEAMEQRVARLPSEQVLLGTSN